MQVNLTGENLTGSLGQRWLCDIGNLSACNELEEPITSSPQKVEGGPLNATALRMQAFADAMDGSLDSLEADTSTEQVCSDHVDSKTNPN